MIKIGKILVVEFQEKEYNIFNEIMAILEEHNEFEKIHIDNQAVLSFPGLEIHPQNKKVYCNCEEIYLTTKEYNILYFLAANQGRVLAYEQIYKNVWGSDSFGNESKLVAYHISNLRDKLHESLPNATFSIRCVREIGYCFEIKG